MKLPINPKKLLESDLVEKERLELKKGYNPELIIHTITAFANDFNNWGGGYILIGVNDNKEVEGVNKSEIDSISKKIIELCNKIQPTYFPVIEPFEYNNKHILILYCPGGLERPYKAPKSLVKPYNYKLYIRHGPCTVVANHKEEIELINLSVIPFDDRINHKANIDDLDDSLINKYLKETNLNLKELSKIDICKSLNIIDGSKEYLKPKNIGLLMFCKTPEKFIETPFIETIIFFDEIGDKFEEKKFTGDIISQIQNSLEYIKNKVISERVEKIDGQAKSLRYFSYPYQAIKEALVNAVYHKSYEENVPVEIRVELDRIDIVSCPGPLPPLNKDNINNEVVISRRYRNRRIGEFLKEYNLTEGKNTGFRKIKNALKNNGSPKPIFITDEDRVQFITRIKLHPKFKQNVNLAQATQQVKAQVKAQVLVYLKEGSLSISELVTKIGQKSRSGGLKKIISELIKNKLISLTIPEKPKSPNQKYLITEKGQDYLKKVSN